MTIYLIRHAHAGSRSDWSEDDNERPLTSRGRHESDLVRDALAATRPGRVFTSPAVRCEQTVEPLAEQLGLRIEHVPVLFEGSDPTSVIALMEEHGLEEPVLCTHGDIIPEVIDLLVRRGMTVMGATGNRKAAWWAIVWDGEAFRSATYHESATAEVA